MHIGLRLLASSFACLLAGAPSPTDLAWHPALKQSVEKSFNIEDEWRSPGVRWTVDGVEFPFGRQDFVLEMNGRYIFSDLIDSIDSGRPSKFARSFDTLEERERVRAPGQGADSSEQLFVHRSTLAGESVAFDWDVRDSHWQCTTGPEAHIAPDLLKGLDEDVAFRAFVPRDPVAVGASWNVEPEAFVTFLAPGGELGFRDDLNALANLEFGHALARSLAHHLRGSAQATFADTREDGDAECALIRLTGSLSAKSDTISSEGRGIRSDAEIQVKGELLWDLKAHMLRSADLRGDLRATVMLSMPQSTSSEGTVTTLRAELDLTGTRRMLARFQTR